MILAMSQWTAPSQAAGWKQTAAWWALSLLLAKRHYDRSVLIADTEAASFLVDELELPFDEVSTALDSLPPSEVWGTGKLYAYEVMADRGEPFVHIDNDVFLWKRPWHDDAPAFAQSQENMRDPDFVIERAGGMYEINTFRKVPVVPPEVHRALTKTRHRAINTGIVGFNDLKLAKRYSSTANQYLHHPANRPVIGELGGTQATLFFEQYFVEPTIGPVRCLMSPYCTDEEAKRCGYSHYLGPSKKDPEVCRRVMHRLEGEFPEHAKIVRAALDRLRPVEPVISLDNEPVINTLIA